MSRLSTLLALSLLTGCATQKGEEGVNFHAPLKAEWSLLEMQGLEAAYNSDLRPVDQPLSGSERLRQLTLETRAHWGKSELEVSKFKGCNEVVSFRDLNNEKSVFWSGAGNRDNWCGRSMHDGGIGNEMMQDMHHRVFKLFYAAENQFVELIDKVEIQSISSDRKVLELRDANNTLLMRFVRREAES